VSIEGILKGLPAGDHTLQVVQDLFNIPGEKLRVTKIKRLRKNSKKSKALNLRVCLMTFGIKKATRRNKRHFLRNIFDKVLQHWKTTYPELTLEPRT